MANVETRLLPKCLVDEVHCALAELQMARRVNPNHPVVPKPPHPIDCDVCVSGRRVDLLLDEITIAMGGKHERPTFRRS